MTLDESAGRRSSGAGKSARAAQWLAQGSAVVGIISLPLSLWLYYVSAERRAIAYAETGGRAEIVRADGLRNSPIRVVASDGQEVRGDVTALRVAVWNPGNAIIRQEQELEPIALTLADSAAELLDVRIVRTTRPVVRPSVSTVRAGWAGGVRVRFRLLEPGDGFTIQLIARGPRNVPLRVAGSFEGVPALRDGATVGTLRLVALSLWPVYLVLGIGGVIVLAAIAAVYLEDRFTESVGTAPLVLVRRSIKVAYVVLAVVGLASVVAGQYRSLLGRGASIPATLR